MNPPETDPSNEVRNIRRVISIERDDEPQRVFEYYLKHQEDSKQSGKYRFGNTALASINAAQPEEQPDRRELE